MNGLYVHIPFCIRKCPYCDFLSFPHMEGRDFSQYALLAAQQMRLWKTQRLQVDTVFFGGGTPSLIGAENLCLLLEAARESFLLTPDAQITLEANPGTVDAAMLRKLVCAGFDRISFGVQSFCDETLVRIGRIHNAQEAKTAVKQAQDAGFSHVSVDLISALPEQSIGKFEADVREAIALQVGHVSCYDLTIAEGTPFEKSLAAGKLSLPDEDEALLMQRAACRMLAEAGFSRYEISNYAKSGEESLHNLHYWHNDAYIGIGCGAHGRFEDLRYSQAQTLADFASDVQAGRRWHACEEKLSMQDDALESLMLGMRLKEGVDIDALLLCVDEDTAQRWNMLIAQYEAMGLMKRKGARLLPTPQGWEVQNAWLSAFF